MSQHYFQTSYEGRSVTVVVGFDRPLRGFFCFVERNDAGDDEEFAYSNLDDPKLVHCMGIAKTLKHFEKRLGDLDLAVPRSMFSGFSGNMVLTPVKEGTPIPGGKRWAPRGLRMGCNGMRC